MRTDADLSDLWHDVARRATDAQLAAAVVSSVVLLVSLAVVTAIDAHLMIRWWPLAIIPTIAGAFGAWAIADRELAERASAAKPAHSLSALRALRAAAAVIAALATAAAVLAFLKVTVGTWIS